MSEEKKNESEIASLIPLSPTQALAVTFNGNEPKEVMMLHKAEEGKPIFGPMIYTEPREDGLYNLTRSSSGPAQVATEQYRKNYDKIFNKTLN